jgi:hypothetical protein
MSTIVLDRDRVHIPASVIDLKSFRGWFHSDAFPDTQRLRRHPQTRGLGQIHVFGKSFRSVWREDNRGDPEYSLEVR